MGYFHRSGRRGLATPSGFFRTANAALFAVLAVVGCGARTPDTGEPNGSEDGGDWAPDSGKSDSRDAGKSDTSDGRKSGVPDVDDPEREVGIVESTISLTLAPGQESTVCVSRRLPTMHPMDVVKVSADLPPGGHHLIAYKSNDLSESPTPFACAPAVFGNEAPLIIAQKKHTDLLFPPGVAYTLPARQMIRMELHFLNTTSSPLDLAATVQLTGAEKGTVSDYANLFFTGNLSISIPPQSTTVVGPTTATIGDREPIIFGVTGHQHQRGTRFQIELGNPSGSMSTIYDNDDWAEAPLTIFDPPLPTRRGDALRYTCTYVNPTNQPIQFGTSANDEMCFLWAYYYPDMGYNFQGR